MKYPIGIQSFDQIIEGGFVYVDKTDMVYKLVTEGKIYFLGRPRRFGKSLLVSTLKHYFLGHKELFKGLKIDNLEKDWLEYPVFHIDFNGVNFMEEGKLEEILEGTVRGWEREYGKSADFTDIGRRFAYVLQQAHKRTGRRCVVLVDEYDKPLLDVLDSGAEVVVDSNRVLLEERNREVLRSFYSTFKAADADLQFVLLTGVTKFSQITVFSGFNQPADISMVRDYDTLCGITQEELEHYFAEPIAELAQEYRQSVPDMMQLLKQRYDGYHFSTRLVDVYNPFSLLNVFRNKEMQDYWFSSGTPTYLLRLLNHAQGGLDEMTGKYYERQEFIDYRATVDRLPGDGGKAIADDLPERLPDHQGLQLGRRDLPAGFSEQRGEEGLFVCHRRRLSENGRKHREFGIAAFQDAKSGRPGIFPETADSLPGKHSLQHAPEERRAGMGALFPLHVLPHLAADEPLRRIYGERAKPGTGGLHRRDGQLRLHLRVQIR